MIIKDKKQVIEYANATCDKLFDVLCEQSKHYNGEDDSVDLMYFLSHTVGMFYAKATLSLSGFSSIYGIDNDVKLWIDAICNEYYEQIKVSLGEGQDKH
jgi:hypothetical protein